MRYTYSVKVLEPRGLWFDSRGLTYEPKAPYSTHKYVRNVKKLHTLLRYIFNQYPNAEVHVDRCWRDKKGHRYVRIYSRRS